MVILKIDLVSVVLGFPQTFLYESTIVVHDGLVIYGFCHR